MDADHADVVVGGGHGDELLARAVIEAALKSGRPWAQIAAQLGVPPPPTRDGGDLTEHDWQEAIIAHENARAARLNDRTSPRRPETP